MPTTVTKTVGPGKDYASLHAAIAGEARNLVSADEICEIVCYAMEDTIATSVSGFTTDATRYVRIRVNPADRHDGTRTPGGYWLHCNEDFSGILGLVNNYTRLEGFQVTNDPSNGVGIECVGTNLRIIDTLIYDCGSNGMTGAVGHEVTLNNCAAISNGGYGFGRTGALDGFQTYLNCTSVANGGAGFRGYTPFGNVTTLKNCYAGGNAGDDYDDTDGIDLVTCYSEDGTASSTTAAYSINSGARFLNVTNGSEDVHHTGSSTLRHAGTDLGADGGWIHPDGQVDIDGDNRDPLWDIGVDQAPPDAVTNLSAPTISGDAFTGFTLTATGGVWADADSTTGKWQRETGIGTDIYIDIVGETSLTYVLQTADILLRVRYSETATNMSGSTTYPSDPTGQVGTSLGDFLGALELSTVFGFNLATYTYVLQPEDAALRIVFVETATNENGSTDHDSGAYGPVGTSVGDLHGNLVLQTDITTEMPEDEPGWLVPAIDGTLTLAVASVGSFTLTAAGNGTLTLAAASSATATLTAASTGTLTLTPATTLSH